MHATEDVVGVGIEEALEGVQRLFAHPQQAVAVGNQQRIALAPVVDVGFRRLHLRPQAHGIQQRRHQRSVGLDPGHLGIDDLQVLADPLPQALEGVCLAIPSTHAGTPNSAESASTAACRRSRISGIALITRFQPGMKGRSMGRARKASPAFMMFSANISTATSSL